MSEKKYNVAIAGATGAVGGAMLEVLKRRDFPINELRLLASERSVGKKLKFKDKEIAVQLLSKNSFKDIDIALLKSAIITKCYDSLNEFKTSSKHDSVNYEDLGSYCNEDIFSNDDTKSYLCSSQVYLCAANEWMNLAESIQVTEINTEAFAKKYFFASLRLFNCK